MDRNLTTISSIIHPSCKICYKRVTSWPHGVVQIDILLLKVKKRHSLVISITTGRKSLAKKKLGEPTRGRSTWLVLPPEAEFKHALLVCDSPTVRQPIRASDIFHPGYCPAGRDAGVGGRSIHG